MSFHLSDFHVHRQEEGVTLTAEMSDFHGRGQNIGRVIEIVGRDRVAKFALVATHRDREGDVTYLEYAPLAGQEGVTCRVHLFND